MANLLHDFLAEKNTQQESRVVSGHDQPDDMIVVAVKPHIDGEQTVQQTGSRGENGR
jgi:phosphoribosylcarboxyaminoimidazole (NCAIR) mutase